MASPGEQSSSAVAAENASDPTVSGSAAATVGAREAGEGAASGHDHASEATNDGHATNINSNGGEANDGIAGGENAAADTSGDEVKQQPNEPSADQPTALAPQHQPPPQDQTESSSGQFHNASTASAQVGESQSSDEFSNDTRYAQSSPNYSSAPALVLGTDTDRNDFIRSVPVNEDSEGAPSEDGRALNKLKKWFGGPSSPGDNEESERAHNDYHNFSSPNHSNHGAEEVNANEASPSKISSSKEAPLLDDEEKGEGDVELSHVPPESAWDRANSSSRPLPGTEEEERVMGQCSFFYGADTPPTVHHRARRINPRAMAHAIRTGAKRRWTERRYRRRLRQSQFHPYPVHSGENGAGSQPARPDEFMYELTTEHRQAFLAAHNALNEKMANEYNRNRHAIRKQYGYNYEHDLDYDLELAERDGEDGQDEIRADLTKSSLAIRGGLIRLPADNVRLVDDPHLQPGILSIETRDVSGGMVGYENYGNANRYGNINGMGVMKAPPEKGRGNPKQLRHRADSRESVTVAEQLQRHELAYVLTVDERIYQRVVREMGDSYRIPCGIYYCCHTDEGGDHVGIGVAVVLLLIVFAVLVAGMIAWPSW